MANFTPDEIESVVTQLVRSTIRRPLNPAGLRDTDVTFRDTQEAAAGVFLLYPKSPYYLARLASEDTAAQVKQFREIVSQMYENLRVLRRRVLGVTDLSALANAQAALGELGSVVGGERAPRDVRRVPAYVRFNQNLDRFLQVEGRNVKDGTQVVATPNEARGQLPSQFTDMLNLATEVTRRVAFIVGAMEDYGGLDLPRLLASGVVGRAREMLAKRTESLRAMDPEKRLEVLRSTVLEVLGIKAVVSRFTALPGDSAGPDVDGLLRPYADSARPAIPAALVADFPGPYALVIGPDESTSTNIVDLLVDGDPVQVFLPPSAQPKIPSAVKGPFVITAGVDDQLRFVVDGTPELVTLTAGTRTVTDVVTEITSALTAHGFEGEEYFAPLLFDGPVEVEAGNKLTLFYGNFPAVPGVGDLVEFYGGTNAGETRTVTSASSSEIFVSGAPLTVETQRVRMGSADKCLRVVPINPVVSVAGRSVLELAPLNDQQRATEAHFGWYGAMRTQGEPTGAAQIVDFINQSFSGVDSALVYTPVSTCRVLTVPGASQGLSLPVASTQGSWSVALTQTWSMDTEGVMLGDLLVLRGGGSPDAVGTVTAVTPDAVTATFAAVARMGTGRIDIGRAGVLLGMVVRIQESVNLGDYTVIQVDGTVPFDVRVKEILSITHNRGQAIEAPGVVAHTRPAFVSRNTTTASQVTTTNVLPSTFFLAGLRSASAFTRFMSAALRPGDLEEGDVVEFYSSGYETPTDTRGVMQVEGPIITLDDPVDATTAWALSGPPPFARFRTARVLEFAAYRKQLQAWLSRPGHDLSLWAVNYMGLLQPLLVNGNPTDSAIGEAEQTLRAFMQAFEDLDELLSVYDAPVVPEMADLIKAFRAKGAERAVDMLRACRFSDFFGLSQEETSYSGTMLKVLRDVAREDIPVKKTGRPHRSLIASAPSPDYETDLSDLDTSRDVTPPKDVR